MGAAFDPYHRWLSIPIDEQPPNHYRLLGLLPFESDRDAIASAADRQIRHVRSFLDTPLHPFADNLLGELRVARRCLLNQEAKAAYDAWLEQQLTSSASQAGRRLDVAAVPQHADASPVAHSVPVVNSGVFPPTAVNLRRRRKKSTTRWFSFAVFWLLGAPVGLLAGYAVLCMIGPDYDFLHLMSRSESANATVSGQDHDVVIDHPKLPEAPRSESRPEVIRRQSTADEGYHAAVERRHAVPSRPDVKPENVSSPDLDPLTSLPTVLPLPDSSRVGARLGLAPIPIEIATTLQLSLIDGGDGVDGQLRLTSQQDTGSAQQSWAVEWVPAVTELQDIDHAAPTDVGTFAVDDGELQFMWSADVTPAAEAALVNSLLNVQIGDHKHLVPLRAPVLQLPLTIDLTDPVSRVRCAAGDFPDLSRVRLDVTGLPSFPPKHVDRAGLLGLEVGDSRTIWYSEVDGAGTRLSLVRRGRVVVLEAESRYRLPSGDEEGMSIVLGRRKFGQLRKELDAAKTAQAYLPELKSYLNRLRTNQMSRAARASTQARAAIQAELEAIQGQIKAAQSLADTIPAIQQDLKALNEVSVLAEQLHLQAKVPFRLYMVVGDYEVDLVDAHGLSPALAAPLTATGRVPSAQDTVGNNKQVSVGLFGVQATGGKVAYVVECSARMEGELLAEVKRQLLESIRALDDTHRFQIIFFNDDLRVFDVSRTGKQLSVATVQNKDLAIDFVTGTTAGGDANRLAALRYAVSLDPDVIFFVTDGSDPVSRRESTDIWKLDFNNATVCTIELGRASGRIGNSFLTRLADHTAGQYRYVEMPQLSR